MEIITRQEAIDRGHDSYFTGKACKNGHVALRRTVSCTCVECMKESVKKNKDNARERILAKRQADSGQG